MFCAMQTWQALTRRSWERRKRSCLAEIRTKEEMLPCMHVCSSVMSDCLWPYGLLVPLSMGFSSKEYWSGLPCPPPGVLLDPGIKPTCLMFRALTSRFFTSSTTWCCHKWHENQKGKKKKRGKTPLPSSFLWPHSCLPLNEWTYPQPEEGHSLPFKSGQEKFEK